MPTASGSAFVMDFVAGETIARKLLRDAEYAAARAALPEQLAAALARIHAHGSGASGASRTWRVRRPGTSPAAAELARYDGIYRAIAPDPHPAFELAFRWLGARHARAAPRWPSCTATTASATSSSAPRACAP